MDGGGGGAEGGIGYKPAKRATRQLAVGLTNRPTDMSGKTTALHDRVTDRHDQPTGPANLHCQLTDRPTNRQADRHVRATI